MAWRIVRRCPVRIDASLRLIVPLIIFLFSFSSLGSVSAQTLESGRVLKWESRPYSQSAHITRNQIVYWVRVDRTTYQISRRHDKAEMVVGEQFKCRIEKAHFFVINEKGKETKYDIVGVEGTPP